MKRSWPIFLLFLCCGCGPRLNLQGTWLGYRKIEAQPNADPAVVRTLSKVQVTIDGRGRFSLFEAGMPKTGNVRTENGKGMLQITEVMGRSIADSPPPIELTPDGPNRLTYHDPSMGDENVPLTRQSP